MSSSSIYYLLGTTWYNSYKYIPYTFYNGSAVVYNNKIHMLGSQGYQTRHYSFDGDSFIEESTLPYKFYRGAAVVYNNKIHIFGGFSSDTKRNHYSWDGTTWTKESDLPYDFYDGSAVVYNNKIYIFGSEDPYSLYKCYVWEDKPKDNAILTFENDVITMDDGTRYQILNDSMKELSKLDIIDIDDFSAINYEKIGPESSMHECRYIYGD